MRKIKIYLKLISLTIKILMLQIEKMIFISKMKIMKIFKKK